MLKIVMRSPEQQELLLSCGLKSTFSVRENFFAHNARKKIVLVFAVNKEKYLNIIFSHNFYVPIMGRFVGTTTHLSMLVEYSFFLVHKVKSPEKKSQDCKKKKHRHQIIANSESFLCEESH